MRARYGDFSFRETDLSASGLTRRVRAKGRNRLYDRPSVNADSGDVSSPPSFGSIWAPILSSRPWRLPKRGAQDLSRTARWRRPQGLSLTDRAPRYAGCDLGVSVGSASLFRPQGSSLAGLASRSMARAMIASAYIRQLRSGLPICCMHGRIAQEGWDSSRERQNG